MFGVGYWVFSLRAHFTVEVPHSGGTYREGVVGQPRHINPLLSSGNVADSDLVELVFSGLLRYDREGNLQGELAEDWSVSEDGREFTFFLRRDLTWHDGEAVTIDDVIFTYEILQNPAYGSPLRKKWPAGVRLEKIDDVSMKVVLTEPVFGFLDNMTVGILPKHIWQSLSPDRFALSTYNLEPIGTGPYRYASSQKNEEGEFLSYTLKSFARYYEGAPYIKEFGMVFFFNEEDMVEAYRNKEIKGLYSDLAFGEEGPSEDIAKTLTEHMFRSPQYYVIFFNQTKNKALAYDEVRRALALATDREVLVDKIAGGEGVAIDVPFLPGTLGNKESEIQSVNIAEAENALEDGGWKRGEDGVRARGDDRLEFTILTADWGRMPSIAEELKSQWEGIGARVNVSTLDTYDLSQNHIRPKDYESLLYVQAPGLHPNLFSYWHSTQKDGDGLNLSLYSNKTLDESLEKLKTSVSEGDLSDRYREFREVMRDKNPAIYLMSATETYPVYKGVLGITDGIIVDYAGRLSEVSKWYINTRREWKQ